MAGLCKENRFCLACLLSLFFGFNDFRKIIEQENCALNHFFGVYHRRDIDPVMPELFVLPYGQNPIHDFYFFFS